MAWGMGSVRLRIPWADPGRILCKVASTAGKDSMAKSTDGKPHDSHKSATRLVNGGRDPFEHHGFINPPVYHASTVVYRTAEDFAAHRGRYLYGRRGTPTSEALADAIAGLEGPACAGVALVPSGLAAASVALLSALRAGNHVLVTDSV